MASALRWAHGSEIKARHLTIADFHLDNAHRLRIIEECLSDLKQQRVLIRIENSRYRNPSGKSPWRLSGGMSAYPAIFFEGSLTTMPIYEYECLECGRIEEAIQKFSDRPRSRCTHCSGKLQKLVSHSSFHLKGSGWYVTDYAGKSDSSSPSGENTEAASKETKKSPSTDTPKAADKSWKQTARPCRLFHQRKNVRVFITPPFTDRNPWLMFE